MMEMEQWKQPSVPSFQRLEDTEAVPDVHSVDGGLPNVSAKLEKEEDDPWESNHQCSEENKDFPDAHSGFPVATMKMDEPWEHKALGEIENIVDQCLEFPEGMTEVKDEEESWDHQAVEENNTSPSTCSEFPEGMTEVKDEEELWDHQSMEENKTVPSACSGFPVATMKMEEPWEHKALGEIKNFVDQCSEFPEGMTEVKDEEEPWEHETLWEFENIADQCSEFPEGMTEVKDEEESWDHQSMEENKTVPSACSEFPIVKVKMEEEEDSLESDVQDDEEEFSDVKVKLEEDDDTLDSDVQDDEEEGFILEKKMKKVFEIRKEFPDVKVKLEEKEVSLESDVQVDEEGFPSVTVTLESEEELWASAEKTGAVLDVQSGKKHRQPKKKKSGAAGRKRRKLAAEEAKKAAQMEYRKRKKKPSGAQGRKRRKLAAEEAKKSGQMECSEPKKNESGTQGQKRQKLAVEEAKKSGPVEYRKRKKKPSGAQGRKRRKLAAEEAKKSGQTQRREPKKKESGAQARKRRKLAAEAAAKKSRQVFLIFFKKPQSATSIQSEESPGPSTSFPVAEVTFSAAFSKVEENVKMATSEGVEMEKDKEFLPGKTEPVDKPEPGEPEGVEECSPAMPEVILKHDVGLLPFDKVTRRPRISDALRTQMVQKGFRYFQNSEGPFKPTPPQNRRMSKRWFKVRSRDGQGKDMIRSWLMYSPSKGTAFCFCCLLFSRSEFQSVFEMESGFDRWTSFFRITVHETGSNHRKCFTQWKLMERNFAVSRGKIDTVLQTQIEKERQKWREILSGVLDCVKSLVIENLPYRGHRESFQLDYESNVGNFLEFVKLLAHHDPVMKRHLANIQSHPCSESYLSPGVQNEFIHLMASAVRQNILRKIRSAKYYGVMFDTTPDLAHRDQMSEVVRYVEIDSESRKIRVRESFLGFIRIHEKDAENLTGEILRQLEEDKLDLKDCRSQCYNNTAVMAGLRSGVHQRITEKNHLALLINCDYHSLNLVGVHAFSQEPKMGTFFADLDALYVFFAKSDKRWGKLQEAVPFSLESQSETRWSAKAEAVKPLRMHLEDIIELLQNMEGNRGETDASRREAKVLVRCLLSYDFLSYVGFWDKVVGHIDLVQRRLQDPSMNFHYAAENLRSLQDHFDANRDNLVSESIDDGLGLCQKFNVEFECRRRYRKTMPGETARDARLTAKEEMERSMKAALDHLHREMNERFSHLHSTDTNFGFLLDIEKLCYGTDMQDLQEKCVNLGNFYSSDVDGQKLYQDILDCRMLLSGRNEQRISSPEQLLEFIQFGGESAFSTLTVATQILLTIAVSIASCERTFSKLKLILSYLSSSMDQQRLCDLTLLCVEREETEKMDFNDIIDRFASAKARKVPLM